MITIWKTPIVATVEQVLKDLKLQLYGAGLLREIKNTGSDLMCTCPFHANGKEHNPSCGVLLQQKVTKDKTYEAGTVHCYTCGYTADLYHGKDVVYDATNLKASYRVEFLDTLRLLNCKKVCVFVDTPFEVCIKRNEERERTVPKDAMDRMKRFLEPPTFAEGWDRRCGY